MHATSSAIAQGHEHVYLDSDDLEDVTPTSVNDELIQSNGDARLELRIFNGAYASVRRRSARARETDYWVNLAFLDPEPLRRNEGPWVGIAGASGILAGAGLIVARTGFYADAGPGLKLAVAVALLTAITSAGIGFRRFRNRLYFVTRHGRVPVLRLAANNPGRSQVRRFVDRIGAAARAAHQQRAAVRSHYLRDEMKEHRRLREAGVLAENDYEAAKVRVLAAHG
jgi:hypothetical protein